MMSNGNVGILLFKFMELIRICKLFFYVIKKFDLNFFTRKFKMKYSNVLFDYKFLEKKNFRFLAIKEIDNKECVLDIGKKRDYGSKVFLLLVDIEVFYFC